MEMIFHGTADPIWGNAILSRVGFLDHGGAPLPLGDTLLPRGYVWAHIDLGMEQPVRVIATHLHHIPEEPEPRLAQIPVLLDFWGGAGHTILAGDLNSEPDWPEMDLIRAAGMVDSWSEAGQGPGLTWPADDPFQRIDWIWLSPDLQAIAAETVDSAVSDHRAVVADLIER
jgi:endonuclease/exonuclease/phosphatase family metal-dependent hydrolase